MSINTLLSIVILLSISVGIKAQVKRNCAAQDIHEQKLLNNAEYRANNEKIEARYRNYIIGNSSARTEATVRTIPVYVHVIYNSSNSVENISDLQIQSQINVLNADFSATNTDVSNVPAEFASSVANYEIQFELISISRKASSKLSWGTSDDMKKTSMGGVDPISPDTHLNMWICEIGGGILGYAQFPGDSPLTDGVVIGPQYFGSSDEDDGSFYLDTPYDKGRTATHEVGHYLNLNHIWGDGDCSKDDLVDDTPIAAADNGGCPVYPSKSCTNNGGFTSDMFMNYMDYVDDACMYMFTQGQKTRTASIFASGGARENLGKVCSIGALTGLISSNIGNNGFDLSWSATFDATDYDISINNTVTNQTTLSYSATGLNSGTEYTVMVRPNCVNGKGVYSDPLLITTTGSNCGTSSLLTFSLQFDDYPEETSWELKREETIVASGSGYGNPQMGTTLVEVFDFGMGTYSFTINDNIGDGICCDYGVGMYEIKDGNNKIVTSGASFGFSETTQFCVMSPTNNIPVIDNQIFSIDENSPNTTVIGTVVGTDIDPDVLTYTLISDNSGNGFAINSSTGELSVNESSALNFENLASFTLNVQVSDGVGGSSSANITVNLNDVNDVPVIGAQTFTIDENSLVGVSFGLVAASDEDGDALTYSITSGNTNDAFMINSVTGEISIKTSSEINFEVNPTYTLEVRVDDGNGASSTNFITIDLNNLNDIPLVEDMTISIVERSEKGTVVGTILASDEDGDVLSFAITSGNTNQVFLIDNSSGQITVNNPNELNLAVLNGFTLSITANDGNGGIGEGTLKVDVLTGFDDRDDQSLIVYPNPISDRIYVMELPQYNQFEVKIFDLKGRKLLNTNLSSQQLKEEGVDTSSLEFGSYLLIIQSTDKLFTKQIKLIK